MKFIADLHIHSRYSRATSKSLDPERLFFWARKKGIAVIGTGDFTHPAWISELGEKLVKAEEGLFRLAPELEKGMEKEIPSGCPGPTRFLLTGEISCIYKKNGKTRKVHHLILMPDMPAVERFRKRLDRIGNITSDGRPILGLDSHDLLETTLEASDQAFFIPAHVWTPWFSLFGSKSGFDTLEECFEDLSPHIHCLETGLSSDPEMNRLISALDRYLLVSNSDAHSPSKLGREANLFDTDLDYPHMVKAMKGEKGFSGTIEFYPEEGKYHLDGHRKCRMRCEPPETRKRGGICPVCGKPVTVGVLNRVHELADREEPVLTKKVHSLIPLTEVLSELLDCGPATKKVAHHYEALLRDLGPELRILMEVPLNDMEKSGGPLLAEAVRRMRQGKVIRDGGYDGEFGRIRLFSPTEKDALEGQLTLFRTSVANAGARPQPPPTVRKRITEDTAHTHERPYSEADPILGPLNDAQRKAVLHEGGHLLVAAGPGTGKTMTLAHRMAHMIRSGQIKAEEILGLTFTRKAAREMEERIVFLLQGNTTSIPRIATFHGFCLEVLRAEAGKIGFPAGFSVCGEMDREAIVAEIASETGGRKTSTVGLLKGITALKRAMLSGGEDSPQEPELFKAFGVYQKKLADLGMVDLDDLEVETLKLFERYPPVAVKFAEASPEIFVDEYQDTNRVQVNLLKVLVRTGGARIFAIGDPDQAIYGFRGAEVEHFYRFGADFPGAREITLTRNYRSAETLLKGAAALLGKPAALEPVSREKGALSIASCRTEKEEGEMIVATIERLLGGTAHFSFDSGRVTSHEEGLSLGFDDIGILYRLNAQGDAVEVALNRAGIPLIRSGETPLIETPLVKLVWRFLQTVQYPETPFYLNGYARILDEMELGRPETFELFDLRGNLPGLIEKVIAIHDLKREKGEEAEALGRLMERAELFEGNLSSFLDSLTLDRGIDHAFLTGDRVGLMSLHAAKGLEWPVVFITGCEDGLIPCTLFGERNDAEERRLFYVGMTRARSTLVLSHARRRSINGRVLKMGPSPLLETLPPDLRLPLPRGNWKPKVRPHQQLKLFRPGFPDSAAP